MPTKLKKCKRYSIDGHAHELTFSCFHRRQFLRSDRACNWLARAISNAREKHLFHIWAYVFMPTHAHLLI